MCSNNVDNRNVVGFTGATAAPQVAMIIIIFYVLFVDTFDMILDICNALLCATPGIEFGAPIGAFFATICNFCNGYCGVSTPAILDRILYDIEVICEKENGYFNFDFKRECDDIVNMIFDKIIDILLAPYGAFFTTINNVIYGLYYPPNVDRTASESDIDTVGNQSH